jgi:hypothetical protein
MKIKSCSFCPGQDCLPPDVDAGAGFLPCIGGYTSGSVVSTNCRCP